MEKVNDEFSKTLEEIQELVGEPEQREKVDKQLNKLDLAYQKVIEKDCIHKLEEETKLK